MLVKYLSLYYEFLKMNLKSSIEYRVDFFIGVVSSLVVQLSGFFFIWLIFENVSNLKGWSFYEMSLVYGFLVLSRAFNNMFFDNLWVLGTQYIRTGNFDNILLKPIYPLFHLVASKVKIDAIGNILLGVILLAKSIYELKMEWNVKTIIILFLTMFCGTLIFASINLITCSVSFWVVNSYHLVWATYSMNELALYPINIYNRFIEIILTWVIPYAFVSFYPANLLIDKGYRFIAFFTPMVALTLMAISYSFWRVGMRNYTSTGS